MSYLENNDNKNIYPDDENIHSDDECIYVITRSGVKEQLDLNKITKRIKKLRNEKNPFIPNVNPDEITLSICNDISTGITTYELDEYAANKAASMSISNPYNMRIASRLAIDNHQKNTKNNFSDKIKDAYMYINNNKSMPLINKKFYEFVCDNKTELNSIINYENDFKFDFFGFRTFQKLYAHKLGKDIIERPQDMFMRTAISLHLGNKDTMKNISITYKALSNKFYTHSSSTYFNAGSDNRQLASCFLLGNEDSLEGIKNTEYDMAKISKWSGGIGVHINCWRSSGTIIRGTNGKSNGIVPFLRMYNNTMRAFNQGGRRLGSAAIYLMPHHPDILDFLKLKRNDGMDVDRARDLFYAVWIPDLFMERVKNGELWSLFDPDQTEDLSEYYDEYHNKLYTNKYISLEKEEKYVKQIPARLIWEEIYNSNRQKGIPYICFSDNANRQSMHKNLGTIKSSNLCSEIYEYSDSHETAVCNLCSINLELCVKDSYNSIELKLLENERRQLDHEFPINPVFDYKHLLDITKLCVENLNRIIDINTYPTENARRSNLRHRPIGIGVQGYANALIKMRYPFESKEASELNKLIFETIYYAAVTQSTRLCREEYLAAKKECKQNGVYKTIKYYPAPSYREEIIVYNDPDDIQEDIAAYPSIYWNGGSPISKGIFHWELAGKDSTYLSGMWDWESTRLHIKKYGIKNSLLIALMPTASTSQLLGNNECIEPFTSNIYRRKTLAGDYLVINKYLIHDLYNLKSWDSKIKEYLLHLEGSIQNIDGIPIELKNLYKTAWEIDQSVIIQQSIDRQPFVDQGQSLNLYVENLDLKTFTKLMFKAWRGNLKTGKYYIHSRPSSMPQKFTIDPERQKEMEAQLAKNNNKKENFMEPLVEVCDLCSA